MQTVDEVVEMILTALRSVRPPAGMERRIIKKMCMMASVRCDR
jgi:hypothetical protein